ncbi:MAG: alpha/beta hydrolase fold domain-containing protein [Cyclobacteriaceae bacterium]
MKQSLTYYVTLLVIKLKGIKRNFSSDPIDFKKIRKEDVHKPVGSFFKKNILQTFKISDSLITEIGLSKNADNLLVFIHGGAFISGPSKHHWDVAKEIVEQTNHKVWLCNYPKAPENQIKEISENIDAIYDAALKNYQARNISIIGDSVGGTLASALVQRLIINKVALPKKIMLVSPVMDATMSNPKIENTEKSDPMLSKTGVLSSNKMCAGNHDLKDPIISPVYGNFEGFPKTILFIAENDIMYPDEKLAESKMKKANVDMEVIEGNNMPHIWPYLPVMKEAKVALNQIIQMLNN